MIDINMITVVRLSFIILYQEGLIDTEMGNIL